MSTRQVDRKHLVALTNTVLAFLEAMDKEETTLPLSKDHGKRMATLANALNLENDKARYFGLGVPYRNDKHKPLKS